MRPTSITGITSFPSISSSSSSSSGVIPHLQWSWDWFYNLFSFGQPGYDPQKLIYIVMCLVILGFLTYLFFNWLRGVIHK